MKSVLVTGATGFVGRNAIVPLLARGFEVHAIARREPPPELANVGGVVWHRADLLRMDDRAHLVESLRPDHLLHLAWVAEHGRFWEAPENADWLEASIDLVARFAAAGGHRVVTAGSCAEYDWSAESLATEACRENQTPCRPATLYGKSKLALSAELATRAISHACGRLFHLYGAWEDSRRLVPSVIQSILHGRAARVGPAKQILDFLDARDAGAALVSLLDSDVKGPVNVASGTGVSVADVVREIGELMGHPERIELGALPARAREPPRLVANVSRLVDEVDFRPKHGLTAGLREAIGWWAKDARRNLDARDVGK